MAILYGTMQNGHLVAVEADAQGRLVAQLANPVDPSNFVEITGSTMTGNLTVPSLNSGPLAGFRNAIINGDFRIWQRGETGGTNTSPQYVSADRWKLSNSSAGTSLNARSASPVGFGRSTGIINGATIQQKIESWTDFAANSIWTISFIADGAGLTARIVNDDGGFDSGQLALTQGEAVSARAGTDAWHRYHASYTLPANATGTNFPYVALEITNPTGGQIALVGIQLEPGPVATPFERRPLSAELALCQRYFYKYDNGGSNSGLALTTFMGGSGIRSGLSLTHPQEMRIEPQVTNISVRDHPDAFAQPSAKYITILSYGDSSTSNRFPAVYSFTCDAEL